ncbi:MAG TPA: ATP-binding protein [Verrucomicrobiae bacterium]|nr:ATP-binding protein [Verrucomicrobiae bacterium]
MDSRQKISALNPSAERLLHLKASRALHQPISLLPEHLGDLIRETLSSGKPVSGRQFVLRSEESGDTTFFANTALVEAEPAKSPGVVVVFHDLSALPAEPGATRHDPLHSAGILSASMAHEIKNAFVAVKTFVELQLEKDPRAELAEVVRVELARIDSILNQWLKFSRPAKPAFSNVHLHAMLDKSLQLIEHLVAAKKIKVSRSFAASPDSLHADGSQLEQAFVNLLFNALDALGQDGRLKVSTDILPAGAKIAELPRHDKKPCLRIIIHDNGAGIAPENVGRLFEPFFTTKPGGTGLGLAITRRIIQDHHGVVTVESEPKKGTTFTVILPTK